MRRNGITRRQLLKNSIALAGCQVVASCSSGAKRTVADKVPLGATGLKLSRLGIGTGSNSGNIQRDLGSEGFNRLIRHAYNQGVTFIDTADGYKTHTWIREAIKGIPRENLFIQTKMGGLPAKPFEAIDRFRQELGVDYIDSLLIHAMRKTDWEEEYKRLVDAFEIVKDRGIIRSHGASYHSLQALKTGAGLDWTDVSLVRINPQGINIDTENMDWGPHSDVSHLPPVLTQIRLMKENRQGIIGMKIFGEGVFVKREDREKSIRYTVQSGLVDSMVIGFKSTAEIDDAIMLINSALAETT